MSSKPSPKASPKPARGAARTTIAVQGARVHNLKNVSVEIPRDKLVVVTGLSGSGKSSLAFDTIYAEGQRRYMESLSTYAKRFVSQVAKPDVDFIYGLSPVISIEQKTIANNPRSTVGTMTDIASYLNLLYSTIGEPHCPRSGEPTPSKSASQILEAILSLPEGAQIELRAPVFPQYGEELDFVLTEVRKKGCRVMILDGKPVDISAEVELDESKINHMDAVVDRFVVGRKHEKAIKAGIAATLLVGDGLLQVEVLKGASKAETEKFYRGLCSKQHHLVYGDIQPEYFMFNNPESACRTCGGLGVHKLTHPELLVPDPRRSIAGGCFVKEAFKYNPDTWDGRVMYSLAKMLRFSLDTPWEKLSESIRTSILDGIQPRKVVMCVPPDAKVKREDSEGKEVGFGGIAKRIERNYRRYRQRGEANSGMEAWLDKVMVEHTCPDCKGARVRATRLLCTIDGKTIFDMGQLHFDELHQFLGTVKPAGRGADAGRQVLGEVRARLELLLGIGLDYLSFNRRSGTLSGWRIAAHSPVDADRVGTDGHAVRARRAEHRTASQGQREDDRHHRAAARYRQHGDCRGARRGHDSRGRPYRGDGSGAGSSRRQSRGAGDDRRRDGVRAFAHGTVPFGRAAYRDAEASAQGQRQSAARARGAREQSEECRRGDSAWQDGGDHRRVGVGQEQPD